MIAGLLTALILLDIFIASSPWRKRISLKVSPSTNSVMTYGCRRSTHTPSTATRCLWRCLLQKSETSKLDDEQQLQEGPMQERLFWEQSLLNDLYRAIQAFSIKYAQIMGGLREHGAIFAVFYHVLSLHSRCKGMISSITLKIDHNVAYSITFPTIYSLFGFH